MKRRKVKKRKVITQMKCHYCDTGLVVSSLAIPKRQQAGAKCLGLFTTHHFGCCPKCFRVPVNMLNYAIEYQKVIIPDGVYYEFFTARAVGLELIRDARTDTKLMKQIDE